MVEPENTAGGETHLFVLWHKSRFAEDRILEDMRRRFQVLEIREIAWSGSRFARNLTRFYGKKLPRGSAKERQTGRGPFLLVIVRDPDPVYASRDTTRGRETVNTAMFDAKTRYRRWVGGRSRVHATNSPAETAHDLILLTGESLGTFEARMPDTEVRLESVQRDLTGTRGWESLDRLFEVLNETVRYLVLRNFEDLGRGRTLAGHDDIDLLTDSPQDLILLLNGRKVHKMPYRVHFRVPVGDASVAFDVRRVGDGYYPRAWQERFLARRWLDRDGFYRPHPDDHFHGLLYHALVHKKSVAPDYAARLAAALPAGSEDKADAIAGGDRAAMADVLDRFLEREGYGCTEPHDLSVFLHGDYRGRSGYSLGRRIRYDVVGRIGGAVRRRLSGVDESRNEGPCASR